MECKISQNLRGGGTSRLKSLVICFTLTLVALIFFGATKTLAIASEDSSNESTPKIDWGFTDSNSLIPIPQQMSNSSVGEAASVVNDVNLSATPVGQVAMYRLYNPYSGEHFYTSDKTERDGLIKIGWKNENIGWVAPTTSNTPVYRLYNSYSEGGDHHYTASKKEYDDLKKAGWTQEGVCWYSVDFDSVYKAAIYRQYNPNQFSCNHNYTIDTKERDTLLKAGWNDEGISYYGLDFSKMAELDFSKFTVDTSNKTYKGAQFKPSVTSTKYKAGTDYIVSYGANKNVGTGTITIQGTGAYYGSKTYTFKINQKVISSVNWSATQFKYTGKPQAPTATAVGLCGKDVANVTVVASGEHIKTGTYVASATAISNKNYKLANIKTNYKIIPATIDFEGKNKVTADASDETYTGDEITKDISVAGLVEGKDYEVIYENNVDAGTATVTIKGIGDYEGETSFTFEIKPISLEGATVILGDGLAYNGQTQTQEVSKVTVKVNGKEMEVPSSALTISNNTGKDADAYEMTVSASGNFTGSTTQPFSIAKKKLTYECEKDTFEYDKETHVPTLKLSGAVEGETVDYSVSILSGSKNTLTAVESAVNAGDYAVSPSLQGDSAKNYEFDQATKGFTITRADPTYTPGTLEGGLNKTLSTVDLPNPASTDTLGKAVWDDDTTVMNTEGEHSFAAIFTPDDTDNYNTLRLSVTVEVKNYAFTVIFDATAPGDESVTMDGLSMTTVEKSLAYDDTTVDTPVHTLETGDFPTVAITSGNADSYYFAGWATSSDATYGSTVKQLQGTTISGDIQYYAVWSTPKGYWLGTADADIDYVDEAYFAENDVNFHSAAEIASDMDFLYNYSCYNNETADKWQGYCSHDNVHLYATYSGGDSEKSYDGATSALNKYVEFRILQVGEHDSDDSVVTFMATHLLPTAYRQNYSDFNDGGWIKTFLRNVMNFGPIYTKFSTDFVSQVRSVSKKYGTSQSTYSTSSGIFKFWILSDSELGGASGYFVEGSQYDWCRKAGIYRDNPNNSALHDWKTRAGAVPGSASSTEVRWWTRTMGRSVSCNFSYVLSDGEINRFYSGKASDYWGVVPAFCF